MTRARIRVATLVVTLVAAGTLTAAATAAPAGAASLPQCPTAALAKAKGTVNISFWESMVRANGTTLTTLTNKFNASQSKIHVTLVDQNSYTTTWQKYEAGLTNGQLPAVAQLQDINLQGAIDTQSILPALSTACATPLTTASSSETSTLSDVTEPGPSPDNSATDASFRSRLRPQIMMSAA